MNCWWFDNIMHDFLLIDAPPNRTATNWPVFVNIVTVSFIQFTLFCSGRFSLLRIDISSPFTARHAFHRFRSTCVTVLVHNWCVVDISPSPDNRADRAYLRAHSLSAKHRVRLTYSGVIHLPMNCALYTCHQWSCVPQWSSLNINQKHLKRCLGSNSSVPRINNVLQFLNLLRQHSKSWPTLKRAAEYVTVGVKIEIITA